MDSLLHAGGLSRWGKPVLWAVMPLLLLTPPLVWLGQEFGDQLASEQRARTQHTLELQAGAVQRAFNRIAGKLDGLAAFVSSQTTQGKAVDEGQFKTFAAGLHADATWLRAFQVVTDGVITHTYPLKGNEAALGYNLLTDPRPVIGGDVNRALQSGRTTVTGPIDLVQGGMGIIVRKPLLRMTDPHSRLVAVVLNLAPLLAEAGVREGSASDVELAIRSQTGAVFFGPPTVFDHQPVTRRIALPDGSWEMGARPLGGWLASTSRPLVLFYLAGGTIVLLLCLLVFVLARSRTSLAETVQARTEELQSELAARRQAEEQLRQSYLLLQAVTEGTSDAVFVKDLRGCYRMINSAGAAIMGQPVAAIIGRDDTAFFAADTARAIMEADRRVVASGQIQTTDVPTEVEGAGRIFQATKAPWHDKDGKIIGVVGVSRDITARTRMEGALRQSERQLSLILNNASDVIFAIAVEAEDRFRFTSVNRRFLEATGLAEAKILGARVEEVIPEPARTLVLQKYREAIASGQPTRWEEISDYPAGRKIGHVTVVPVFDSQGKCTQLVGMVHDVTERSHAEEQVRRLNEDLRRQAEALELRVAERTAELAVARDRAEAADRLKSAFLATMSHELRTPLNSIIGFTGIILQGLAGPVTPEQHNQLEMVRSSARHLLALINDVLDLSKIEAAQLVVTRVPVDVRAAVTKAVDLVQPLADRKDLALRVEMAPETGILRSDRRRIEQVLLNLLNNAIKFTEHGEVTLRVWPGERNRPADPAAPDGATAEAAAPKGPAVLHFQVRDTGIGIKPGELANLFQPFRQLDTGLTRQHEGTGLGLAICRRLAELMGGEITVESEWGRGSVFTFTLPLEEGAQS
ncbi:MAG TPA: PAS domain-containing protein [Opitutaceae bacterium]|nr:PAS domain-containing protein [Opitutaceae bacterium]